MTDTSTVFKLMFRLSNGQRKEVICGNGKDNTEVVVSHVKECIARDDPTTPPNRQRLIYKGRILDDDRTLADYGIANGATLFLVKSAGAPSSSSSVASTLSPSMSTDPSTGVGATGVPSSQSQQQQQRQGSQSSPPLPNAFGMPGAGMGGMMSPDMMNPEQMQQMLNHPSVQNLLDNPERMGQLMQSSFQNPQMRQIMESNPELRQLWNDPAMMQQAMQMLRNPSMMQQAMRQQDLAMSQLENMPGGFAALSNMYRNVQEPMMEAAAETSRSSGTDGTSSQGRSNASSLDAGATGAAMPNPWSTNSSSAPLSSSSSGSNSGNPFTGMPNPWGGAAGNTNTPNPRGGGGGGMPGGMPNIDQAMQMLDNPMFQNIYNDMVQNNPDMLRNMLEAQNPMLRQMFQDNPAMANNFIQHSMNPNNLRSMLQMQRGMQGATGEAGAPGGAAGANPFAGVPPNFNPNMFANMMQPNSGDGGSNSANGSLDFSNLLNQFQSVGLAGAGREPAPGASAPLSPADRFRNQLRALYDMGFDDEQACLSALQANHGNVNRAVDYLLSAPSSSTTTAAVSAPVPVSLPSTGAEMQPDSTTPSDESGESATPKDATEKKND